MIITKNEKDTELTLCIEGRLDTTTAPELEKELAQSVDSADSLVINCEKLDYISSAGLRVLLAAHKQFSKKQGLTITNVNPNVMDIFEVTGFKDILNFK